jgi:hypothetical protein
VQQRSCSCSSSSQSWWIDFLFCVCSFNSALFGVDSDDCLNLKMYRTKCVERNFWYDAFQWVKGFGIFNNDDDDNNASIISRFPDDGKGQ